MRKKIGRLLLLVVIILFDSCGKPGQRETRGNLIPVFLFASASLILVAALYQLHDVFPQQDVLWIDKKILVTCASIAVDRLTDQLQSDSQLHALFEHSLYL